MDNKEKASFARSLMLVGAYVYVNPHRKNPILPKNLYQQDFIKLLIGKKLAVEIPDLEINSQGISGTLIFNGNYEWVNLPWESIFCVQSKHDEKLIEVWLENAPRDIQEKSGYEPLEDSEEEEFDLPSAKVLDFDPNKAKNPNIGTPKSGLSNPNKPSHLRIVKENKKTALQMLKTIIKEEYKRIMVKEMRAGSSISLDFETPVSFTRYSNEAGEQDFNLIAKGHYSYYPGNYSGPYEDSYPDDEDLEYELYDQQGNKLTNFNLSSEEEDKIQEQVHAHLKKEIDNSPTDDLSDEFFYDDPKFDYDR